MSFSFFLCENRVSNTHLAMQPQELETADYMVQA